MKTLGQYIRELRDKKDLSLREFADKLGGLSAAFLSDVELGRRFPSEKVLFDMARVLGVSVKEFEQYDNRPPIEEMKQMIQLSPHNGILLRKAIKKAMKKITDKENA